MARGLAAALGAVWWLGVPAPAGADDVDDLLGGFGGDEELLVSDDEPEPASEGPTDRFWDLTGSVSTSGSVAWRKHRSERMGTNYQGLTRLRTRLNLELELDLPASWEIRAAGFAFYDWAYLARGRSHFTNDVIDRYEWDADTQEFWARGRIGENLDVKIGRQIINWGRSDNLRVIDVLNPLDNREPGLADIEDLRRPVTMARFDYYFGDWSFQAVLLPEVRFDLLPVPGSDFSPVPDPPFPGFQDPPEHTPQDIINPEYAFALKGIFQGWDISFHVARVYEDIAYLKSTTPPFRLTHNKLTVAGAGGNYAIGSWLFKAEAAFLDGLGFTDSSDKSRLDVMAGIEYYGIDDTSIAFEAAERHVFGFPSGTLVEAVLGTPQEDRVEYALRVTSSFFNERLDVTALVLAFGDELDDGSVVRLQADYDIRDALVATVGVLLFQSGDTSPLSEWGRNDRFFFELKWSF